MVTSAIMVTLDNFEMPTTTSSTVSLYPDSALRALFYVPLMGTNILATSLICFKAWYVNSYSFFTIQTLMANEHYTGSIARIFGHSPRKPAVTEPSHPCTDRASE